MLVGGRGRGESVLSAIHPVAMMPHLTVNGVDAIDATVASSVSFLSAVIERYRVI